MSQSSARRTTGGRTITIHFDDGSKVMQGAMAGKGESEEFEFFPGDYCLIQPLKSNRRMTHAGRVCRLTGSYREHPTSGTISPGAIYLDTGKFGYARFDDLVPASSELVAQQPYQ